MQQDNFFKWLWRIVATGLLSIIWLGIAWFFYTEENRMVQSILKLDSLPSSIANVECQSLAITDVVTICSFTIEATDFEMLLNGWNFKKGVGGNTAHNRYAKLGIDFLIDEAYVIFPKEFEHGGMVRLAVDKSRELVIVELYIE